VHERREGGRRRRCQSFFRFSVFGLPEDREGVPFEAWLAHGRRAGGRRRSCQSFFRFLYLVYLKMPNLLDNKLVN
jgi:hypothetical protein